MDGTRATMIGAAALLVVTTSALALALAGTDEPAAVAPSTTPTAPVVQLGGPGQPNRTLSPGAALPSSGVTHTEADVAFIRAMVAHHQQALMMTSLTRTNTTHADLAKLAERMDVSQRDEIALMERWLAQYGTATPTSAGGHAGHGTTSGTATGNTSGTTTGTPTTGATSPHGMPGMLTGAELAQLAAARGADFDRLFLQYMIRHHEGAISMVESLLTGGQGGQASDVFLIAQEMSSDQALEVARMKSMLAER